MSARAGGWTVDDEPYMVLERDASKSHQIIPPPLPEALPELLWLVTENAPLAVKVPSLVTPPNLPTILGSPAANIATLSPP